MSGKIPITVGNPGPSSPAISPGHATQGFRALGALGQGMSELGRGVADVAVAEKRLSNARNDQELREQIARMGAETDEAVFDAISNVPSDADVQPGEARESARPHRGLSDYYDETFRERAGRAGQGLEGEWKDDFDTASKLYHRRGRLQIKREGRRRTLDGIRASVERTEGILLERADRAGANVGALQDEYNSAIDTAVQNGAYSEEDGVKLRAAFEAGATALAEARETLTTVQERADQLMDMEALSNSQRLELARSESDPELRKAIVAEVEHRQMRADQYRAQENAETFESLAEELEDGNISIADATDAMPGEDQAAFRRALKGLDAELRANRLETVTAPDDQLWLRLWKAAASPAGTLDEKGNPAGIEAFKAITPEQWAGMRLALGKERFKEITAFQAKLKKPGAKPLNTPIKTGIFGAEPIFREFYGTSESGQKQVDEALIRLNDLYLLHGEPKSVMEQKEMARMAILPGGAPTWSVESDLTKDTWGQDPKPLLALTPKEAKALLDGEVANIPTETMDYVRDYLRRGGNQSPDNAETVAALRILLEDLGLLEGLDQ